MNIKCRRNVTTVGVFILIFTSFMFADVYVKMKIEQRFEMQEETTSDKDMVTDVEMWINDNYYISSFLHNSMFIDILNKKVYHVDHENENFRVSTADFSKWADNITEEEIQDMEEGFEKLKENLRIIPIKEKKQINDWSCNGFKIIFNQPGGFEVTGEIWITRDLSFEWQVFEEFQERLFPDKMIQMITYLSEKTDLPEIDGFDIEQSMTTKMDQMTFHMVKRVVEVSEKDPPQWIHTFQKKYKKLADIPTHDSQSDRDIEEK